MLKLKTGLLKIKKILIENLLITKIKKWFKKCSLREKIVWSGGIMTGILGIYFLLAFLTVSPAELALAELKNSWQQETLCHETCALTRWRLEKVIVATLKNDFLKNNSKNLKNDSLNKSLKKYFLTKNVPVGFQERIVKIWQQALGKDNPPLYLKIYLFNSKGNVLVQSVIINSFSSRSLNSSDFLGLKGQSPLTYYFRLLSGNRSLTLKQAAVRGLSSYPDKIKGFSQKQLVIIKNLVLNPKTDNHLRQSLVLLLSDYYPLFPKESVDILHSIYQLSVSGDVISRVFAVDILNRQNKENLILPRVSSAEWQKYYNN